tara:strand:- start:430 stop:771 length:342 start_codon:yes stop_codon:yes gene_type:complete
MKKIIINCLLFLSFNLHLPNQVNAEKTLDFYMNDFYTKSNKASQILREIEGEIKAGIRRKVCPRQIKAAEIGILANESLIKAFQLAGTEPPNLSINASQERWKSLLNDCKNIN